jgi:hypothetical protein
MRKKSWPAIHLCIDVTTERKSIRRIPNKRRGEILNSVGKFLHKPQEFEIHNESILRDFTKKEMYIMEVEQRFI